MEVDRSCNSKKASSSPPQQQQQGRKRGRSQHFQNNTATGGRGGGRSRSRRRRPNNNSNSANSPQSPKKKPGCSVCNKEIANYKCPKCRATYCSVACCRIHKEQSCKMLQEKEEESKTTTASAKEKRKSKYLSPNICLSDRLVQDPIEMQQQRRFELAEEDEEDLEEEGLKITQSMMNSMDHSRWLQKELQDGGLRHIIYQILLGSSTTNTNNNASGSNHHNSKSQHITTTLQQQEEALMNAKSNYPNFATFIDKLLVVTGVLQREQDNDGTSTNHNKTGVVNSEYPFETMEEWLENANTEDNTLGHLVLAPTVQQQKRELMAAEHLKDQAAKNKISANEEDCTDSSSESSSDNDDDSTTTSSSDSNDDTNSSSEDDA